MTTAGLILWAILATFLAVKCRRTRTVYFGSCLLAVIPIAVSQTEYGFLPMAGILHVFVSGLYPLGLFSVLQRYRRKGESSEPPSKENL
jgi:hypothetical protein